MSLATLDLIMTSVLMVCSLCSLLLFNKMSRGIFKRDNGFKIWNPPESRWQVNICTLRRLVTLLRFNTFISPHLLCPIKFLSNQESVRNPFLPHIENFWKMTLMVLIQMWTATIRNRGRKGRTAFPRLQTTTKVSIFMKEGRYALHEHHCWVSSYDPKLGNPQGDPASWKQWGRWWVVPFTVRRVSVGVRGLSCMPEEAVAFPWPTNAIEAASWACWAGVPAILYWGADEHGVAFGENAFSMAITPAGGKDEKGAVWDEEKFNQWKARILMQLWMCSTALGLVIFF